MKNILLRLLIPLWAVCVANAGGADVRTATQTDDSVLVQAPFRLTVLKQGVFSKRCFDRVATGYYVRYKVALHNLDKLPHTIDYGCFCLTDAAGNEYGADTYLSVMREQKWEDLNIRGRSDSGLNQRKVRPGFAQPGWIVFEVPDKGSYQLKFRGYLSY